MAQAVAAAGLIGAGQAPVPAAPAFTCPVTNTNTGNVFCSIQDAIEASMTLSGHLLAVPACSYTEFVDAVAPGKDITLAPGASPGCVTITGGLTLGSGDALDMEINGTSACTDYDRFSVNGAVTLGGVTLTPTLGYSPSPGDSYTLIANDGADAVSGQFAEGTNISVGTDVFTINYAGGDGNDVVLTYCGTGKVQNTTTSEWFCTIQAAIDEAQTLNGHTLSVNAGTFNENVTVSKELTINGAGNGSSPATNTVLTPAVSCTGTGITVSAANVTLNNMYVTDYQDAVALGGISAPALTDMALIDYCRYGVRLDGNNSSVSITGTDIQRTTFLAATVGIRAGTANAVNGMTIDDCTINGNVQGMAIFQSSTPVAFDDITIKNSTISNNTQKGLYFEKLSNALLENLTMDNNGTDAAYGFNNGIDINLKYDDYSSITIKDCDITNSGATGTAADLENPAAIAIKARDDASSYNTIPATLTGVTIKNNKITGPRNGIRFGEFGKINNTPSNVTIEGNDLSYAFSNKTIVLRTNNDVNLVCNWHGSTDLPTILATLTEAGSGSFMLSSVLGSGGDSSPDAGFQPSGSCSCPSGNLVTNTNTSETFCTIQGAIDDPDTQNGHTLSVSAGTYIENVIVDKSLTINGPNAAINPCSGTRVAEAIVVPAVAAISSGEIFHVAASNVTISGFTIDGDNPSLASGFTSTNGADIDAAEGVTVYETGINNLTVTNNILQNLSYFGVTLYDYPAGVPSSGHSISNNRFTDFGTYDAGSGIDYWGGGVLLYNNQYAHVSNNCMTNVRSGVQTGNFYLPNPGAATYQVIENNTIQARRRGIFHNLFYSSASPYTLDDNAITALDHISESYWDGILISSHQGVASTTSDNVIDGSAVTGKPTEGIEVWNVRNTAPALISGGSVTGVSIGLFVNNYEGYVSDAGEGAHATVSGLTVTDCPLGAKIFDSPSSTLHAAVNATIQDDCHFSHSSGGTTGILVSGAAASATIQNNDASFHGFTTGIDVDAGSATIDNNHIYDNTTGIRFTDGGSGSVTNNDFDGATDNGTDLRLDSDAGTVSADGGNAFAGDTYGVDNQSAAVVDAENNYWDAPDGPGPYPIAFGSGVNITTNVDYCPYLDAPGGMPLPATACSCGFTCASPITFTGNVTLSTQSQVNTFLNGSGCKYTHITGNLVIDGNGNAATGADADGIDPITDLCNLQELVSIGGSLTIRDFKVAGNPTTLADLANLQTIGTSLTIGATNTNDGNSSFTAIQLNGITDVGDAGAITIRFNTNAVDIELPNLAGQVGATTVSDNGAVDNIDIGSQGAGWNTAGTNSVVVQNNGTLNSVDFSKLTSTGGDVTVSNNNSADLSDINLAQLVTVGDAFTLDNNNANLTGAAIALDALTTVGGDGAGDMNINDIATGTLDLSALVTVNGNMSISNNDGGLVAIELLQLNLVGIGNHTLSITGNNNLTTITDGLAGPAITVTRDVTISTNPNLQTVDLADLTTVTRDVSISGNDSPSLATVNLPALTSVGRNLTIDNDNTATSGAVVSMPLLTTVGTSLTGNMNVSQVASSLTAGSSLVVEGNLTVDDNNPMCALDLSGLTQVKGFVLISDNFENCTSSSIDISNLATVGDNLPAATSDYLTIEGNNDMSALSLTSLTAVNGTGAGNSRSIEIVSNTDMMTSLSMPALITVPGEIYIQNNTNLAGISAPLLPTVGEDLRIVTNPALTSIAFGALTGVTGAFEINNNDALPDLNGFGVLATIGGAATITGNGNSFPGSGSDLTSLDGLASLTTIGGALTVTNNPMLGTCCIIPCGLVSVNSSPDPFTGNLTISGNLSFANGGRCIANGPTAAIEVARTACTVTISSFTSSDNSGIVADDDIICFGDDIDFEVMASATSGTLNYLFFEDVDNSGDFSVGDVTIQNGTSNTCTASGLSAGAHNINIQVSNGGGCEVYSLTIVVTVYTLPSAGITVSNGSVCTGDEITLDGNPVAGTATLTTPVHTWSVTGGSGSGSFNPGTADVNPIGFIGATAGTVDLAYTVTDDYGCVSDPATLTISALPGGMACPGPITYTGNITLDSQTDLNAFIGPGGCKYTHVTGNLTLVGNTGSDPIVNLCNLTELQSVGGAFAIRDFNSPLNPTGLAELSNLANVTGSLTVGGAAGDANTQFNSIISLPALTTVGGTLNMSYNAGVTGLAVNALTSVGTDININNSAGLLSINIGAATVVRDFLIQGNNATALASITAGVTSVGRNLTFDNNNTGAGTTITMAGLTNVTGNCNISEIAAGTLTLPVLATVGGTATFSNNDDGLAGIALPALVSIGNLGGVTGDLSITNNNSLASISTLGSNFTVGRDLAVTGNHDGTTSSLATVDFTGLTQVGRDINLDNDNRTSGGATVNFSNLANVGDDMTISQIAAAITATTALAIVSDLTVSDNNNLCDANLSGLQTTGGFLSFTDNYDLCVSQSIDFTNLQTVGAYLIFTGNDDMPSLVFTDLTAVNGANGSGRSVDITNNDLEMTAVMMPALNTGTTGEFRINGNAALLTVNVPLLPSVGEDLRLEDNNAVSTLNFSALSAVTGLINIDDEDAVTDLGGFAALVTVNGLTINGNNALQTVSSMTGVTTMSGSLNISNNPALNGISGLANLVTINGNFTFNNNDATVTLDGAGGFNSLDYVDGTAAATGNALLANCCVMPCRVEDPMNPGFTDGGGAINVGSNNGPGNCSTLAEARTTCTPVGGDDTDMACSDVASGYTLNVPNATEYHITGINNNGLVASAGSPAVADNQPAGVLADDAWTNTTGADVDVVYSVVPVSTDGCEGASFTVTITIKPEPVGAADTDMACSDVASGYTLGVTGAATYNITNINSNGLVVSAGSPAVANGQPAGVLADDAWTNTTGADVDVVYTVVPVSADGCLGGPFTVTITIKSEPVGANQNIQVCSGSPGTFDLQNAITNGVNSNFSWVPLSDNPNVTGDESVTPTLGDILNPTLINLTNNPQTAVFRVTPSSDPGACIGSFFDVFVNIDPLPNVAATDNDDPICSGEETDIDVTNPNSVAGATYTWSAPQTAGIDELAGGPVTDTGNAFGTAIQQTLTNATSSSIVVTFTITPVGPAPGFCEGTPVMETVTVQPEPVGANTLLPAVCSNEPFIIDPQTYISNSVPSTFTWTATYDPGLTGGAPNGAGNITGTLVNNTANVLYAVYTVVPASTAGCVGKTFTVTLPVSNLPEVICPSTVVTTTSADDSGDCDTEVDLTHPSPTGYCTPLTMSVAFSNGSPAPVSLPSGGAVTAGGTDAYTFALGQTVVTYTVTDDFGNTDDCNFTVTVTDDENPEITACPGTVNIEGCNTSAITGLPYSTTPQVVTPLQFAAEGGSFTENCSISTISYQDAASGTCPIVVSRTWTITDAANLTVFCVQTINIDDNTAPLVDQAAGDLDATVECDDATGLGAALVLAPTFTDNCDPTAPAVLQSSVSTKGTDPEACDYYSYTITRTWTAKDACNNESLVYTQVITVQDTEEPEADQAAGDLDATVECDDATGLGAALVLAPTFTDNCDPTAPAVLQSSVSTKGTDPEACDYYSYTITRTWTAKDACNNESLVYTQVITVQDTEEPEADQAAGDLDATVECDDATGLGAALVLAPTFTDNCDPTAPAVLQSSVSTKGTDPEACDYYSYTITRTWTAKDACNNESLVYTQVITVQDTEEPEADQAAGDLDATVECDDATGLGAALVLAPTFTDNCDPTAPAVLQSSVSTKGTDPEACDYYSYTITRTWTAKDACNNESLVYTQVITVQDTEEPEADQAAGDLDATVECDDATGLGAALVLAPTFTDNCDPTAPAVLQSSVSTKGTDPEACDYYSYTITRTWTAKDACNNESLVYTQVITVQDTEEPEADQAAGDLDATVECDDATGLGAALVLAPTFTDNCDPTAPAVLQSSVSTKGTDPEACDYYSYTITRTWTAKDACNNESLVYTQVITVQDTEEPEADQAAGDLDATVECDDATGLGAALVLAPTFTDNCDPTAPAVLQSSVSTKGTDPEACDYYSYTITRTWTAKDACNNESLVYTQVITVQDTEEPEADQAAGDLDATVECDDATGLGAALVLAPTFTDNCDPTAPAVLQSSVSTKGTDPEACDYYSYTITRTWTAKDACNNESLVYTQVITVQDTEEPEADQAAGDLDATVECDDATGLGAALVLAPTFTDNCDPTAPAVLQSSVSTKGTDPEACDYYSYTITRTWTAKDACNNESLVYTQVITVQDTEEPEVSTTAGSLDATLECDDASGVATALAQAPAASDNCDGTPTLNLVSDVTTPGSCTQEYVRVRTWNFTDDCGNAGADFVQTITVQDETDPVISTVAGSLDATLECSDASGIAAALALQPSATDNCDGTPTLNLVSDVTTPGICTQEYVRVRTWNFTDDCGNAGANFVQTITVQDETDPVVYCIDNTVTLGTNGAYTLTAADVLDLGNTSDACGSYSVSISPATVDCSEKDLGIPVSVTVTDECGNANTCTSLITVDEGSTLPSPWSANDIGSTAMGTSGFSPCTGPGTFTLSAKGFSTNISDVAHFVDQQLCGNSSITVRVTQLTGGGWAGIYFRENLTQGSRMVSLKTQLTTFLRREVRSTPGGVKSLASIPVPQGAHWLRIVRTNNLFVGYYSLNGVNWSFAFSASVNMQSCAYVGMFVESINNTTTTTASFDNVTVQGALPPFGDEDGGQLLTQQPQVNVFPNPTNGLLSIDFGALAGTPAKVQIFNSQGQVVKSLEIDEILEREQIDLSPYTDGVYWVRIFVDGVLIDTKKVIKQEVGYYRD
jgi:hypothetical protein